MSVYGELVVTGKTFNGRISIVRTEGINPSNPPPKRVPCFGFDLVCVDLMPTPFLNIVLFIALAKWIGPKYTSLDTSRGFASNSFVLHIVSKFLTKFVELFPLFPFLLVPNIL